MLASRKLQASGKLGRLRRLKEAAVGRGIGKDPADKDPVFRDIRVVRVWPIAGSRDQPRRHRVKVNVAGQVGQVLVTVDADRPISSLEQRPAPLALAVKSLSIRPTNTADAIPE